MVRPKRGMTSYGGGSFIGSCKNNLNECHFNIILLNVQCISQVKMLEIEEYLYNSENINLFCMLETHQKRNTIKRRDKTRNITKMRNLSDRKGGGMEILWIENENIEIEEIECKLSDLLCINVRVHNLRFKALLIYLSTNDNCRNRELIKEAEILVSQFEGEKNLVTKCDLSH